MRTSRSQEIIDFIKKKEGVVSSHDIVEKLGLSRQMVARYLSTLVQQGVLKKTGSTRKARYQLARRDSSEVHMPLFLKFWRQREGLHEEDLFTEVDLRMNLKHELSDNVHSIVYYAFTEMVNNAIDHSDSKKVYVEAQLDHQSLQFSVRDYGVGVFARVMKGFHLENEYLAVEHVIKGKQTTQPEAHSGQGIFFTSRIADWFQLQSHRISYTVDNRKDQKVMGDIRPLKGTKVSFQIKRRSRKQLEKIFKDYADADFEFDRTDVRLKLKKDKKLISRSQAKRLTMGLDKYKLIILDFKGVSEVGQGFVDQIFRVFKGRHPEIQLVYVNAGPAVEFMIQRCQF